MKRIGHRKPYKQVNKASELTIVANNSKQSIHVSYEKSTIYENMRIPVTYGTLFNCKNETITNNSLAKIEKNLQTDKNVLIGLFKLLSSLNVFLLMGSH